MYNEKLNCIDAVILTGGQTTYFLKIENDSLKEFASVDQSDGIITAKILEENGKWMMNGEEVEWKMLGEECVVYTGGEAPVNSIKGEFPTESLKYPIYGNMYGCIIAIFIF